MRAPIWPAIRPASRVVKWFLRAACARPASKMTPLDAEAIHAGQQLGQRLQVRLAEAQVGHEADAQGRNPVEDEFGHRPDHLVRAGAVAP